MRTDKTGSDTERDIHFSTYTTNERTNIQCYNKSTLFQGKEHWGKRFS
jgi:hypothetical protein